jgi:toluene monooxygenase system ferredoxin subunit
MTANRRVATLRDLWDGEMRGAVVDDVPVLVAHVGGKLCAYLNRCPHLGTPLSEGSLEGTVLTCRAHHWQFDIVTGQGINPASASLTRLATATEGDDLLVYVSGVKIRDERIVGPVLLRSAVSRALAEAICAANACALVESRGAYLRVSAPSPCVVTRQQVEAHLGAAFSLPGDLERAMPSYRGRLAMTDEEMRWD